MLNRIKKWLVGSNITYKGGTPHVISPRTRLEMPPKVLKPNTLDCPNCTEKQLCSPHLKAFYKMAEDQAKRRKEKL